jgi:hypothetical protein
MNAGSAIHLASWWSADDNVAHGIEGGVRMAQIISIRQRNRRGLNGPSALGLPICGLNVIRRGGCRRDGTCPVGRGAESLKKIVRSAVLLKDNHDMLELRDLGMGGERRRKPEEEQRYASDFHGFLLSYCGSRPS